MDVDKFCNKPRVNKTRYLTFLNESRNFHSVR